MRQYVDVKNPDEQHGFDTVFEYIKFETGIVGFWGGRYYRRDFFESELSGGDLGVDHHRL